MILPMPLLRPLILAVAALPLTACASNKPEPRARAVAPDVDIRDTPAVLRNTIGSMVTVRGGEPLLVSGYGVVVGLNGTGSSNVPGEIRTRLEREMALKGVGQESMGMGWTTPSRMLSDPDTAVVLVTALIPPGSPEGTTFDVLISAAPGTDTTSLEGGRLWTTELFRGLNAPVGPETPAIATASGDLFINPFTDPATQAGGLSRLQARVLGGGVVTRSLDLVLLLDVPSHARARAIVSAVNARFPEHSSGREPVARGVSEDVVELNVPDPYANDPVTFLALLLHTRVDSPPAPEMALRYTRALREQPELADDLEWCIQNVGRPALPYLRDLYDSPQAAPRLAALTAGARLSDPLAEPGLLDLAFNGQPALRTNAIELLGDMRPDPRVNARLRELLDAPQLDVRIAAYEALTKRFDSSVTRRIVGDRFILDVVESEQPMIYVTQQEQPRIALFGGDLDFPQPILVSGWSDRLMLTSDAPGDPVRVYYRDYRTDAVTTTSVSANLADYVRFLAHEQTPEEPAPGLNLTYSETVGALFELARGGALPGPFVAEQDRLAVELLNLMNRESIEERPEGTTPPEGEAPPETDAPPPPAERPEG